MTVLARPMEYAADVPGISLQSVNEVAALQTRVDRKYVIPRTAASELVASLEDSLSVLEINDVRTFGYESVYFDTADHALYLAAAHRRRRRFKVRTRTYYETGVSKLEIKTKGNRGETVKRRIDYDRLDRRGLTDSGRRFVDAWSASTLSADQLIPTLTTTYDRTTFVDRSSRSRMTIDSDLVCSDEAGLSVELDGLIVETKSSGPPTASDRWLWLHGYRPTKISKFSTGLAALHPELPLNKWHRTINDYFKMPPSRHSAATKY